MICKLSTLPRVLFYTRKEKTVDKSGEKVYNKGRGEEVALENQRYGRNKDTLVNKTYIESGEYRRKFDNITDNADVNRTLYECAKKALKHRSGTVFEDMYWIDGENGKIVLEVIDSKLPRGIAYTDRIKNAIKDTDNIITLHTHPSSMPPSISDLNSCYKHKYKMGLVACHDGKVFVYKSNQEVSEQLYISYISQGVSKGYDEYKAQLEALERLKKNHSIVVWEV